MNLITDYLKLNCRIDKDEISAINALEREETGVIYNKTEQSMYMDARNYKAYLTVLKYEVMIYYVLF